MAAAARVEVRVGDAVALPSGRPERVGLDLARRARATRPVISWPKIQPSSGRRSGASPRQKCRSEPQTLARETRISTPVRLDLRQRNLADLERLARSEEDGRFAGGSASMSVSLARPRSVRSPPSSKASCSARTASSVYLSSMTQETAISDVEIIWMLMPSADSASNMRAATPEWLRMPTPTMETLATRSSATTPSAPISRRQRLQHASARAGRRGAG